MSPSFETLVEQVRTRSTEEKEELKFLLERALIEERRREIRGNHRRSLDEVKRGKLKFSSSIADLKNSLGS
jgi:metallophosphoesterase superfamily enzyme